MLIMLMYISLYYNYYYTYTISNLLFSIIAIFVFLYLYIYIDIFICDTMRMNVLFKHLYGLSLPVGCCAAFRFHGQSSD